MAKVTNKISAVIPAYSDISIVNNSVIGLATQWIPDDTFQLEIIIVNDNPEKPEQYDYYLSDGFKAVIKDNINLQIIQNKENLGQGMSRNIGIKKASSDWVVLCDEDDIYAPNAIYRFWEILEKEYNDGEEKLPISVIAAPLYGFDKDGYRQLIPSNSIWVNSKLYNRRFLIKHNIWFPEGANSHRAEDYPFIRCLDYAIAHDNNFKRIDFNEESDTFYWWFPNYNSRSRCDEHYGSLLAGYTMRSSNIIFDFFDKFNKTNGIDETEDEYMKHEILNMTAYSFYNFLWFIRDLACGWDDCKEEYWNTLVSAVNDLRKKLLIYWDEIVPSDVVDMLYGIKNMSDCRFVESWIGSFEDFVENGHETLDMNFEQIKEYASTLEFDGANHEIHSSYVKAWEKRHKVESN
jgi:glycosyltransferase involved in cell wall biosynthesis